jgi:cytochrome c556
MFTRMKTLIFLLLVLAAGLVSAEGPGSPELAPDTRTLLDAIHSSRLRDIMSRLNRLSYERGYTELELDRMRAENVEALVDAALQLSQAAERLPDIAENTHLAPEERITFSAMARQLYQQTLALQDDLNQGRYSELQAGYQQLRYTCNACHNLFRQR